MNLLARWTPILALATAVTGSLHPATARAGEPRVLGLARRVFKDPRGIARTLRDPKAVAQVLGDAKSRALSHPTVGRLLRDAQATGHWLVREGRERATRLGHGLRARWNRTRLAKHLTRARKAIGGKSRRLRAQLVLLGDALEQRYPKIAGLRRHNPLSAGSFIAHKARADAKFIGAYVPFSMAFTWAAVPSALALLGAGPVGVLAGQRLSVIIDPIVLLAREHYLRNARSGRRAKSWLTAFRPKALAATARDVFGRQYREHVKKVQQRNRRHAAELGLELPKRRTWPAGLVGPSPATP